MSSPKVITREYDLSQTVGANDGIYGLVIGEFDKGPVNQRFLVTSQAEAEKIVGTPKPSSSNVYQTLNMFLERSNKCWVTRVAKDATYGGAYIMASKSKLLATSDGVTKIYQDIDVAEVSVDKFSIWVGNEKIGAGTTTSGDTVGRVATDEIEGIISKGKLGLEFLKEAPPVGAKIYIRWSTQENQEFKTGLIDLGPEAFEGLQLSTEIAHNKSFDVSKDVPLIVSPANTTLANSKVKILYKNEVVFYANDVGKWVPNSAAKTKFSLDTTKNNEINFHTGKGEFHLSTSGANVVKPTEEFTLVYYSQSSILMIIAQDNPGDWGKNICVTISDINTTEQTFKITVFEKTSRTIPELREEFVVSLDDIKDGYGVWAKADVRINDNSYYIRVVFNPFIDPDEFIKLLPVTTNPHFDLSNKQVPLFLKGGTKGTAVSVAEYINALKTFNNKDDVPLDLVLDTFSRVEYHQEIMKLCDREAGGRGDCFGLIQIPLSAELSTSFNVQAPKYINYTLNTPSSYYSAYFGHIKIYDSIMGRSIWVPQIGAVAGAITNTLINFAPWFPAAGWNRGRITVLKTYLTPRKPTIADRDILDEAGINMLKTTSGEGTAVWNTRTLYGKDSYLREQHVRLLLIQIQNDIIRAVEFFLFELNNQVNRKRITSLVEDYLGSLQTQGGLTYYEVKCDETNNTSDVLNRQELVVDYYITPVSIARTIIAQSITLKAGLEASDVAI